ncbi:MAG: M23 family metallopeptidase [Paramuribaculum sp.]|nr:M23 family metallopeptidase [Paramuribaculum sp.]
MIIKKLSATIAAAAIALFSQAFIASAQYKLPEAHDNQHKELLAAQRPIAADIKLINTVKFIEDLRSEDILDNEVFSEYWESQLVNPYTGATIPDTKELDVSSYVSPLENIRVTSNFGYRPRFRRVHKGIDLGLHVGDTVRAAFDGKVRICRYERRGYGYYVVIRHDNGMETVYGHLSKFIAKPNDRVKAGDPIALGGNTGRSTGPHLHFETRYMGIAINPASIIDFENKTPFNGTFTFDRAVHDKAQTTTVKKSTKRRVRSTASKSRARRKK